MKGHTHLIAGAGSVVLFAYFCPPFPLSWQAILGGFLGGLLPDIDHPKSILSKTLKLNTVFKHRGFTHSLCGLFLLFLVGYGLQHYLSLAMCWGILIGTISHILLDSCTPAGVQLLYPIKKRYRIPLVPLFYQIIKIIVLLGLFLILIICLQYT